VFQTVLRSLPQLSTIFERHLENNQEVQWRPGSWGPPINLLVALQMSLRESYESLKEGFQKSSCTLLTKRGRYATRVLQTCFQTPFTNLQCVHPNALMCALVCVHQSCYQAELPIPISGISNSQVELSTFK
jgi:hypothetical protein